MCGNSTELNYKKVVAKFVEKATKSTKDIKKVYALDPECKEDLIQKVPI